MILQTKNKMDWAPRRRKRLPLNGYIRYKTRKTAFDPTSHCIYKIDHYLSVSYFALKMMIHKTYYKS